MPIIKPRGLLKGDRMAALSDEARLYWPFLYAGSNGYGCLEMDYHKIVARSFGQFYSKPSRDLILRILREYRQQSLLFIYRAPGGQSWAAWDSAAVQSFYTLEDKAAPKPPEPEFSDWKRQYQESKGMGRHSDELDLDRDIDTKTAESDSTLADNDIGLESTDITLVSGGTNRLSESESQHQTSQASNHLTTTTATNTKTSSPRAQVIEFRSPPSAQSPPSRPVLFDNALVAEELADWSKPDPGEIATALVDELYPQWLRACSRSRAVEAAKFEILKYSCPGEFVEIVRRNFGRHLPAWLAAKAADPDVYIPHMHVWLIEGYYLQDEASLRVRAPSKRDAANEEFDRRMKARLEARANAG